MRALFLVSISATLLTGCLTTQENPNYEHSTAYRNAPVATQQYASATVPQSTNVVQATTSYQSSPTVLASDATLYSDATSHSVTLASHDASTYQAATTDYPIFAHPAPAVPTLSEIAPTDHAYRAEEVTGTPGFMAMQGQSQASSNRIVATAEASTIWTEPEIVTSAPIAAATPIAYDYSRNLITADALTTGQQPAETVRLIQGSGQSYIVQPGDTVYSLSRRTCVGVNVIQSMNGIGADYGIQIGQTLTLPASVC